MKKLLIMALCIGALAQCKKKTESEPDPIAATPEPTGSIMGNVAQRDQYGALYTTGLNTTTVSLFGTSYKTVTDASGNYTLSGVPASMYDIVTEKPGCPLYRIQQINFPGSGTMYRNTSVCDKPTYTFNSAVVKDSVNGSHKVAVTINMNNNSNYTSAMILYSTSNTIDIDVPSSYFKANLFTIPDNKTTYTNFDLMASGLATGTYYVKIYPFNYSDGGFYSQTTGSTNVVKYVAYGTPLPTYSLAIP